MWNRKFRPNFFHGENGFFAILQRFHLSAFHGSLLNGTYRIQAIRSKIVLFDLVKCASQADSNVIQEKSILLKNSNFDRVANIGRNDEIWPEMCPWGVLESFCTPIRYFIAFRSIFMKFQKMAFLTFWIMISAHLRACRIFYGSKIGQPI